MDKKEFQRLVAELKAKKAAAVQEILTKENLPLTPVEEKPTPTPISQIVQDSLQYNEKQSEFINLAAGGKSCILIGAAGTGKTTSMKGAVARLCEIHQDKTIGEFGHKSLTNPDAPGIIAVSFTRRAVTNLRKAMPDYMKSNTITIHKLLEFEPVFYEVWDSVEMKNKNKVSFEPKRNAINPLPPSIHTIIIDESSMVSVDLFNQLVAATPHKPAFIFLGDIQQLPPVFGPAILGYKMLELSTVELTEVYRQALDSPIIRLAHRILSGKPILATELGEWNDPGKLKIHPWKKKIDSDSALMTAAAFFKAAHDNGSYDPEQDMILIPFNKAFGTIELNKNIANHLARKEGRVVHQIIAGFNTLHLSVGDKVLFDKEDAIVLEIKKNIAYSGKHPAPASTTLDYWGHDSTRVVESETDETSEDVDAMLAILASQDVEDRVNQASHVIKLRMMETDREVHISTAGDLNALLLGYALTVHKSQGSEWRKVFCLFHQSHGIMLQRELLYTAVTRAREELYVICEPNTFKTGIESQRIKGNTLAEKAEYFKGKPLPESEEAEISFSTKGV